MGCTMNLRRAFALAMLLCAAVPCLGMAACDTDQAASQAIAKMDADLESMVKFTDENTNRLDRKLLERQYAVMRGHIGAAE